MRKLHSRYRGTLCALTLALASGFLTVGFAPPVLKADGSRPKPKPEPKPRPEPGFVATGEVRERDERTLSIVPWAQRLPARVGVAVSAETRFLRQRKGALSEIAAGDLVLVVEAPPSARERKSLRAWQQLIKKPRPPRVPERIARARALIRCWGPSRETVGYPERQAARALLTGALPFFRGPSRGGVKPPSSDTPIAVGRVASVEPLTLRTPNGTIHYTPAPEMLVINHEPEDWDGVRSGQTVLVHSAVNPGVGKTVAASLVAISPRPRLDPARERRLILRKRKREMAVVGKEID